MRSTCLLTIYITKTLLQLHSVSLVWRLDREMGRRLILHKTGFNRYMFFTSYFIDVDTFYLFLNWFSTRVSDNRKYVCRRLYACINTRKFKGLDSREITSLPEIKEVINVARHFNHRRKEIACSSQEPFAYNESLQHPTIAVLLIKILNFFDHSVVFTCPKVINAFKR